MRRIPQDVLQEIFLQCLPKDRNPAMSAFEGPVLLGRICAEWRLLVLQTPALWARIHIVEPSTSAWPSVTSLTARKAKVLQRLALIQVWLDRSGQYPLSISFQQDSSYSSSMEAGETRPRSAIIRALIPYAPRWETIQLSFPIADELETFGELANIRPSDVSKLKSFSINSTSWSSGAITWDSLEFLRAPHLHRLSVSFRGTDIHINELPVDWDRLTSLEISEVPHTTITPSEIVALLGKCTALRTCKLLWNPDVDIADPQPILPTFCPEMRSLDLSGICIILSHISCPELRRLDLGGRDGFVPHSTDYDMSDHEPLLHILSTAPKLESLRFRVAIPQQKLLQIISALPPTLLELELFDNASDPQLDDEIVVFLAKEKRCPRLEELILRKCELLSDDGISAFLQLQTDNLRRHSFRRLKVHYAVLPEGMKPTGPWLQPFTNAGINVSIKKSATYGQFSPFHGLQLTRAESTQIYRPLEDEDLADFV
ncbi:hypothetical protein C8F01DRAFT_1112917 [Mycena amicta]|nr:hypothetical protein C8F01DRAFT_1112917 [Mycena amicta]